MALEYELISQFAKLAAKDTKTGSSESTVYGTVVSDEHGNKYIKLDGSDQLTPLADEERPSADSTNVNAEVGERVSVLIKDHTATVTGNMSSPAARTEDVTKLGIVLAEDIQANSAYFKKLLADEATLGKLVANEANILSLIAKSAEIDNLLAGKITVTDLLADKIDTDVVIADTALIESLKSSNIDVLGLIANQAVIRDLVAENADLNSLEAKNAYLKYVSIDSVNIDQAWMDEFYAKSGLIEFITADDATVTGHLVGVTISGDMIKAGTLVADKLVVRGDDGNYYKLNTDFSAIPGVEPVEEDAIHGSVMVANSITAEKISVSDLVAFNAKIAGFSLTNDSIYSGSKSSIDNTTKGIYMDNDGQIHFGYRNSFVKFYKAVDPETGEDILDEDGNPTYKLAIAADTIMFGGNDVADLKTLTDHVKIGTYVDPATGNEQACVELAESDEDGDGVSDFKQVITSTKTMFMDGQTPKTQIDTEGVKTDNLTVNEEFRQGGFVWATRENGNYGLIWKEATS